MKLTEDDIRMAESLVSNAKKMLAPAYDDYADVQRTMFHLEQARLNVTILLGKFLNGKLR